LIFSPPSFVHGYAVVAECLVITRRLSPPFVSGWCPHSRFSGGSLPLAPPSNMFARCWLFGARHFCGQWRSYPQAFSSSPMFLLSRARFSSRSSSSSNSGSSPFVSAPRFKPAGFDYRVLVDPFFWGSFLRGCSRGSCLSFRRGGGLCPLFLSFSFPIPEIMRFRPLVVRLSLLFAFTLTVLGDLH